MSDKPGWTAGPCPFCGQDSGRIDQFSESMDEWRVCCEAPDCGVWGPERKTQTEAQDAWNTRAALRLARGEG